MIFFFGTRTAHVASVQNNQAVCQSCNTQGSLAVHIFRRHFHIFWVPIFPLAKSGISECGHCKNVLKPKEMSTSVRNEYDKIKKDSKGPVWQFAGLIIVAALIIFIIIASKFG